MQAIEVEDDDTPDFWKNLDMDFIESNQLGYLFFDRDWPPCQKMAKGEFVKITVVS